MNLLELGENIKKLRKEKNITQEQLSSKANISRATLSKLENGHIAQVSRVFRGALSNILNILGYELDIKVLNPFRS